jgi:predicted benzoate:H+ symporter BenE
VKPSANPEKRSHLAEIGGAFGDLGTFVPHVIGAITVAGLPAAGVLFGFGAALIGTGLFYGIPMAVQPMKAVSAVVLAGQLGAAEVAATGLVIGLMLLVLGVTGWITYVARLIPQSVSAGLQLGLGASMAFLGVQMIWEARLWGFGALGILFFLMRLRGLPAAPLTVLLITGAAVLAGEAIVPADLQIAWRSPAWVWPSAKDFLRAVEIGVLLQLPLTLTNAVIVTAVVAKELFPRQSYRSTERNLALSTGLMNVALSPLGAMPMCHGAGGLQAQYRFGARTGLAPILFGVTLVVLALGFSEATIGLFSIVPAGAVGSLLVIAGADLALSRRLFDARRVCWPAIGITAGLTLIMNPAIGLLAGCGVELGREALKGNARKIR